jgi:hypothetical protein
LLGYRRAADSGRYQLAYFAGYAMWTYQDLREKPFGLIRVGEVRREERPGVLTRALPRDADGMVPAGRQPGRHVETDSLRPTGDQDSFRRHIGSFREWPDSVGACA